VTIRTGLTALCFTGLVITGGAQIRDLPGATDSHGGFALPDQRGGRLLQVRETARPERSRTALCSGGRRVGVQFDRRQVERANDGRQTGANFDTLAGSVYIVLGDAVDLDATCFLPSETLLAGSAMLSVAAPDGPGACLQRARFATQRDRPVVRCWPLARLASEKHVALLEFERRGKDALASIVVVDGSRTMFADLPAEFRGAREDLWRADDGGVLTPDGLQIVCVLQRGDWYALATAWQGAEGRVLSLWISEGSQRFTKVLDDYWYQAPK
jgi:hypothetical protein